MAQTAEATPRIRRTVAVKHPPDLDAIARELNAIVDEGVRVLDVIVEHGVYGELRGILMLQSRRDVQAFLDRMAETGSEPLSTLTGGVHLHTLEADREEDLDRVERVLDEMGLTARSWDEDGEA